MRRRRVRSAMTRDRRSARRNGDSHENRRTLAGRRLDLQVPADERRTLPHAGKPESAICRLALRLEADAVVFDDEENGIGTPLEHDLDAACARVLRRVRSE